MERRRVMRKKTLLDLKGRWESGRELPLMMRMYVEITLENKSKVEFYIRTTGKLQAQFIVIF